MPILALLTYAVAAAALLTGLHWAEPRTSRRRLLAYGLAAFICFSPAILGPWRQLPFDLVARLPPYADDPGAPRATTEPQNPVLSDLVTQILPLRAEVRSFWSHGEIPFWSHRLGTGQPLWANPQAAVLGPLQLATLHLEPSRAMSVAAALQTALLLAGADALAVALGAGGIGALLAAAVAAGASFHVVWLYHPLGMAFAWIPAFLLGVLGLAGARRRAPVVATTTALGMVASGQPQIALFAALGAALVWLVALLRARHQSRLPPRVATTVAAGALTLGLAAPLLLPTAATLPWSERALLVSRQPGALNPMRGEPIQWLAAVDPFAFGSPRDGNWNGPWNSNEIASVWAGTIPTALALAAALLGTAYARLLVLAGLAALAIAQRAPPFAALADALPGLAATTNGRLRLFWPLAVAFAAALAVGALAGSRRLRVGAATTLVVLGLLRTLGVTSMADRPLPPWQQAARAAAGAAALIGAAAVLGAGRRPRLAGGLLLATTAGELALTQARYHPWVPAQWLEPPAAVEALKQRVDSAAGGRISAFGGRLLPYDAARHGLADPRGFDPFRPAASLQLLRRRLHRPAYGGFFLILSERATDPLLDRLAVDWALAGPELATPTGWTPGPRVGDTTLLRNDEALPLAFVPSGASLLPTAEAALEAAVGELADPRHVYLEASGELACPAPESPGEPDPAVELLPNGLRIRRHVGNAGQPVLITTSISYVPGWRVVPAPGQARVCRTEGAFLALALGPGVDGAELRYRPPLIGWSLGAFAVALAGALFWALQARRRHHGDSAQAQQP